MKKRWAPWKAVVVVELVSFVLGCVVAIAASMANGSFDRNPEAAGERFGRALGPLLIIVGIITYFVQRSRIRDTK